MVQTFCKICFKSNFDEGKKELLGILAYLRSEVPDMSDDDMFELRVIFGELISNAIIHGNHLDTMKNVELFVEIDENDITSVVRDEGNGFDYVCLFKKPWDLMNEHGRGLHLVCSLADVINFNDCGNEITFHKRLR